MKGLVVVITGATGGIGSAIATKFAKQNASLALVSYLIRFVHTSVVERISLKLDKPLTGKVCLHINKTVYTNDPH